MVLVWIAAACCLLAATLMFTPRMRSFRFYRPVAIFFLSEGIWLLGDYAVDQIAPGAVFMDVIHYIILIVIAAWMLISVFIGGGKKKPASHK